MSWGAIDHVDLGVRQRLVYRLQNHVDRYRLFALAQRFAFEDIKYGHVRNQRLFRTARRTDQFAGPDGLINDKGKVAPNRLQIRYVERGFCARGSSARLVPCAQVAEQLGHARVALVRLLG